MRIRTVLARPLAGVGAVIAATALAACSGSSGGADPTPGTSTNPVQSTGAASGSAPIAGPSIVPTGSVGPLTADSDLASILATAEATMRGAQSFLFSQTVVSNGQTTVTSLQVDKNSTAMGTITSGTSVTGIRISGLDMWLTGPASFWTDQLKLGSAGQIAVAGKWVLTSRANAAFAAFSYSASIGGVAEELFANTKDAKLTKLGITTVDGVQAIGVSDNAGSILQIALADPYRPLRVDPDPAKAGTTTSTSTVSITQWGAAVPFQAPPADQVISFDSIPKSG
ncbi:MAG: Lipoprotein [Pseudonocardiales bacterium]|nr:Lipoprotein [Pseudonocardiales bacterium]